MAYTKYIIIFLASIFIACQSNYTQNKIDNYNYLRAEFKKSFDSIWEIASEEEQKYLKFLYNNLPVGDIIEHSPEYHYKNIKTANQTKRIFSWASKLPETEFIHFVLPYRVNNENLDTSRAFFMHDIKDRIINMSMLEAAIEVNHWCHEHVTYRAADARTSSPLATYKNGYGRCGEESTFTVAALRSVGIPARQVYTPRWAHTDDNHAWVEFYADGKWYFYGACEPAPEVNQGWFTEAARRAMLENTKVIGDYNGNEKILNKNENYSTLNTLNVYAETKSLVVKVLDANKNPINEANVEFLLYNYAEFYPIAVKKTNENGYCEFTSGLGDLIVWASKNNQFNFIKTDLRKDDTINITLHSEKNNYKIRFDIKPPIEKEPLKTNQEKKEQNDIRLLYEDSIRAAYEKTFIDTSEMIKIAAKYNLPEDKTIEIFSKSRANWNEILHFIEKSPKNKLQLSIRLLQNISNKDLRDTPHNILSDHLENTTENPELDNTIFEKYILNPRVRYELISAYRKFLKEKLYHLKTEDDNQTAANIKKYILNNIKIIENENYYNVSISPIAVFKSNIADLNSLKLFYIASLRSLGIAAREKTGTLKPQYFDSKTQTWKTVTFYDEISESEKKAFLSLKSSNSDLKYFKHFTISQFENGSFKTLQYQWDKKIDEFSDSIELKAAYYRLTTGTRTKGGDVIAEYEFFDIVENQHKTLNIELPEKPIKDSVIAEIDNDFKFYKNQEIQVFIWLEPRTEPTKHIINDIIRNKEKFEEKSIEYNIISASNNSSKTDIDKFELLPAKPVFLIDDNLQSLKYIEEKTKKTLNNQLPIVIIVKNNKIVFLSRGYIIGISEDILNFI